MNTNTVTLLLKLALILLVVIFSYSIVTHAQTPNESQPKICEGSKLTESLLSRGINPESLKKKLQQLKQSAKSDKTEISEIAGGIAYKLIFPPIGKPTKEYMADVTNTMSFIMCQLTSQTVNLKK